MIKQLLAVGLCFVVSVTVLAKFECVAQETLKEPGASAPGLPEPPRTPTGEAPIRGLTPPAPEQPKAESVGKLDPKMV